MYFELFLQTDGERMDKLIPIYTSILQILFAGVLIEMHPCRL